MILKRRMRRDLKERIRARVVERMDALGISGRELAKAIRPQEAESTNDSWISSIITGRASMTWDYIDAACDKLNITPGELVRDDASDMRELKPSEMRLLRHWQMWPQQVQDRLLKIADYFSSIAPEPDQARLLAEWEELSDIERREVQVYLYGLRQERLRRRDERGVSQMGSSEAASDLRRTTLPDVPERKLPANLLPDDDPEPT